MIIKVPTKYQPLYTTEKPIVLITGGRGSAKSFNTSLFCKRLTYEANHKILFTRYTLTSAQVSIIPEFNEKIDIEGDHQYFKTTKSEILNTRSGSEIMFRGIKTSSGNQTANLKSIQGLSTFVVDEAEEWQSEDDYDKIRLSIRQKGVKNRVIIVMNPTDSSHFIYQKYIKDSHKLINIDGVEVQISTHPDVEHIHTTYLDNLDHLSDEFLREVETVKERNFDKYARVIIGRWADRAEGAIFDYKEGLFDNSLPYCYGQDYGFTTDPTTLVRVAIDKKKKILYCEEMFYKRERLGTQDIADLNKQYILKPNDMIVGDSAEPRLISDLKKQGLNIRGSEKGGGSVQAGITRMQDYTIVVTPDSHNLKTEFNNYKWSDKKSGVPVDDFNHCIDAIRYAVRQLDGGHKILGYASN